MQPGLRVGETEQRAQANVLLETLEKQAGPGALSPRQPGGLLAETFRRANGVRASDWEVKLLL